VNAYQEIQTSGNQSSLGFSGQYSERRVTHNFSLYMAPHVLDLSRTNFGAEIYKTVPLTLYYPFHQQSQEPSLPPKPAHGLSRLANSENQMASVGPEHEVPFDQIRKYYVLPKDPSPVLKFLSEHRTSPQILLDGAAHLKDCFGEDAVFNLRAPIDEDGSQMLYAVVMWPGALRDVRQALTRFDEIWWIAHARQASGYLTFTYELV